MEEFPSSEDKEHADAEWLRQPEAQTPASPSSGDAAAPDEAYEVVGSEPGEAKEEPEPPIVPPTPEAPPRSTRPKPTDGTWRPDAEPAVVDVVWSRWGEWGPDLIRVGLAALATLFCHYLALRSGSFSFAFLVLLLGMLAMAALSYPLAVTLERPVRVTPEQAVKDYYDALSHSLPHYRRMWLLLSSAGRTCPEFAEFEVFESYWRSTIAALN